MIPHKKHPKKQLEKYSLIFLQLSLVLVLFITHVIIENVIAAKVVIDIQTPEEGNDLFNYDPVDFVKFTPPQKKVAQLKVKQPVPLDVIKKGEPPKLELPALTPTVTPPVNNPSVGGNNNDAPVTEEPPVEKVYDYKMITPLFKGCKDISLEENRACFDKKMKRFVHKKFDADLGIELGLSPGNYKIYAQFIIDEQGAVKDVQVRAPHPKMNKEVQQMIEKLPQFIPGKVGERNVKVRYLLPISFKVD